MMSRLLITLVLIFNLTACNNCDVPAGVYLSAEGSEVSKQLILGDDQTFILTTESWLPGQYEQRETTKTSGTWRCEKDKVELTADGYSQNATLIRVGKNPLMIPEDSQALSFSKSVKQPITPLDQEVFYLQK